MSRIVITLPASVFRAITLGLSLGDEIAYIVKDDGIIAAGKGAGLLTFAYANISKDSMIDFIVEGIELPFKFSVNIVRVLPFAKKCAVRKGAIVRMTISEDKIKYEYKGDRYMYLVDRPLELTWNPEDIIKQAKESIIDDVVNNGFEVKVSTKKLKQSLNDIKKFSRSADVLLKIEGNNIYFEGRDEISSYGFGLAAFINEKMKEIKKMSIIVSMDVMKEFVEAMEKAVDTVNMYIKEEMPIVAIGDTVGGEVIYMAVPRVE